MCLDIDRQVSHLGCHREGTHRTQERRRERLIRYNGYINSLLNAFPLHTMTGGLIIRFDIFICILYVVRDIYTGCPLKSELLQNYKK